MLFEKSLLANLDQYEMRTREDLEEWVCKWVDIAENDSYSDQEVNCNMLSLVKRGSVVTQLKRKIEVFQERLMKAAAVFAVSINL